MSGRADVDQAALAEVEAAAVERADLREDRLHVLEPLDAADQVGALDEVGRVLRVEHQVAAHARGGVHDHVDVGSADPLHGLAVELHLADPLPVSGSRTWTCTIGRAGTRRSDARTRRSARGDRHVLAAADGVAGPVRAQVIMTLRFIVCFTGAASCSVVLGSCESETPTNGSRRGRPRQAEIAEVAVLPVRESVVVGPRRRLHDDHVEVAVDVGELAAAAVGGRPPPGVSSGHQCQPKPA
jgi:hypothetical protein